MKDVPGLGGRYCVDENGNVFTTINTRGNPAPLRALAQRERPDGYRSVQLRYGGKNREWLVHRLVAMTFIGQPGNLDVNHIDGRKSNNHVSNLEYVTRSENCKHALRLGLRDSARGERVARARLSAVQIQGIRDEVKAIRGEGRAPRGAMKRLAQKYGVTPQCIDHVARMDCWLHVPDPNERLAA